MQNDQDDGAAEIDPLARMKSPSDFAGQQLFIQGEDWHNNAMLGWTHFPGDIYAAGYKDTADALVGALVERKASLDSVVYPLVFLYRQGLELQLKLILPLARRLAGKEASADIGHKLMPLWNDCTGTSNSSILARTTKSCRPLRISSANSIPSIPVHSPSATPRRRRARCRAPSCGTSV